MLHFARAVVALLKQSFHAIGQKKNEAILLAQSDEKLKKVEIDSTFFSRARATFL